MGVKRVRIGNIITYIYDNKVLNNILVSSKNFNYINEKINNREVEILSVIDNK